MSKRTAGPGAVIAPWPFLVFGVTALLVVVPACSRLGLPLGTMVAFDTAALLFVGMCARLFRYDAAQMRLAAQRNDANRGTLLLLAAVVTIVVMVTVGSELAQKGQPRPLDITLVIATLCLSWLFSTLVYTLHYAHLFYTRDQHGNDSKGLTFPHTDEPDYWDFAYFSSCLAMTFQTSDVTIDSRVCRRTSMFHCLGAFVFNIGVLAFSINILGGS